MVTNCKSKYNCKTCGERHNTLLHLNSENKNSTHGSSSNHVSIRGHVDSTNPQGQGQFASTIHTQSTILFGTAIVRVRARVGHFSVRVYYWTMGRKSLPHYCRLRRSTRS